MASLTVRQLAPDQPVRRECAAATASPSPAGQQRGETRCARLWAALGLGLLIALSGPAWSADPPPTKSKASGKAGTKAGTKAPAKTTGKSGTRRVKAVLPVANPDRDGIVVHYDRRVDVLAFIDELSGRHGFEAERLKETFAQVRHVPMVARLMMPATASQPKSWTTYRNRFVEPRRIGAGLVWWDEHSALLERAAQQYGVPEEIIVGITGVETIWGRNMGSFRVVDALTTLAFDYPNKERDRSPFFRAQLIEYLLFARTARLDVFDVRGSYAGAIGIPQFMPGSYRRFAVDFDGDGITNLRSNHADAIGSVANFLKEHGWVSGVVPFYRTVVPAELPAAELQRLIGLGAEPQISAGELRRLGFPIEPGVPDARRLALIDLPREGEADDRTEYVLGTENFLALTRYNRSYFYAMAVAELGAAIKAQRAP